MQTKLSAQPGQTASGIHGLELLHHHHLNLLITATGRCQLEPIKMFQAHVPNSTKMKPNAQLLQNAHGKFLQSTTVESLVLTHKPFNQALNGVVNTILKVKRHAMLLQMPLRT